MVDQLRTFATEVTRVEITLGNSLGDSSNISHLRGEIVGHSVDINREFVPHAKQLTPWWTNSERLQQKLLESRVMSVRKVY
jgi:hypothetical protein